MTAVPFITVQEAQRAYELADLEVELAVFVYGTDALEIHLLEQKRDEAEARWRAVKSQVPDRRPFVGRRLRV